MSPDQLTLLALAAVTLRLPPIMGALVVLGYLALLLKFMVFGGRRSRHARREDDGLRRISWHLARRPRARLRRGLLALVLAWVARHDRKLVRR